MMLVQLRVPLTFLMLIAQVCNASAQLPNLDVSRDSHMVTTPCRTVQYEIASLLCVDLNRRHDPECCAAAIAMANRSESEAFLDVYESQCQVIEIRAARERLLEIREVVSDRSLQMETQELDARVALMDVKLIDVTALFEERHKRLCDYLCAHRCNDVDVPSAYCVPELKYTLEELKYRSCRCRGCIDSRLPNAYDAFMRSDLTMTKVEEVAIPAAKQAYSMAYAGIKPPLSTHTINDALRTADVLGDARQALVCRSRVRLSAALYLEAMVGCCIFSSK